MLNDNLIHLIKMNNMKKKHFKTLYYSLIYKLYNL
jgi:hypothetical protein